MTDFNSSTNMNMPVPIVGTTPGPDWASDINACLSIIDTHDHSSGSGVQITPGGININSDLPFGGNNLTLARSLRLSPQSAALVGATDLGCLYEVGVDLYYNDGNGNSIRITQSGAVAGTPGSISNLVSPATASYVSGTSTFVWQSNSSIAANMDFASAIYRNISPNSTFGVTVSAPTALGSNYTIVLPALPASQKFMTLDASGNMGAPWAVDSSTIEISSNTVQVKALGITSAQLAADSVITSKIADSNVTTAKIADSNVTTAKINDNAVLAVKRLSLTTDKSSSIVFTTTSSSFVDVTGSSVTIGTVGHPVVVFVEPDGTTNGALYSFGNGQVTTIILVRNSTEIARWVSNGNSSGQSPVLITTDSGVTAGLNSWKLQMKVTGGVNATLSNVQLRVIEI